MKTVAIIPIKSKSERIPGKNLKRINGIPFYQFLLRKIKKCNFDEVYIDTDNKNIKSYAIKNKFKVINRLKKLATKNANGNDLLNYHSKIINADIYFQLFITAPLLRIKTINNCIKFLKNTKKYDSIFTINKIFSWFWFNNKPVNYKPKILPRSQDAKPIIKETTGLYGIKKKSLKKFRCRIGKKPFLYEISEQESIDLDTNEDFKFLNYLLKNESK